MTLDNHRAKVIAADEYDYVVVSKSFAEIWVSPKSTMSFAQIATELRRLANFVESTNG